MKRLLLLTGILLTSSCITVKQKTQETLNQKEATPVPEIQTTKTAKEKNKNEAGGWEEFEGNQILQGELYTSKGAILGIQDVFISQDYKIDAAEQRPKLRPLVGKRLEIKGDVYTYYCGPLEQCLTEGSMKWLRNVEYVKVID